MSLSETANPSKDQDNTRPEDNTHQTRKNTPGTVDTEAIKVDEGEEVILGEGEGPTMQNNAAINKTAPLVLAKRSQLASAMANNDHDPTPKKRGRPSKGFATKAPTPQSQSWGNILILKELKLQNDVEQHLAHNADGNAEDFFAKLSALSALPSSRIISSKKELEIFHNEVNDMRPSNHLDGLGKLFVILRVWEITDKWLQNTADDIIPKDLTLAIQGKSLQFICQVYGIGSIFWLQTQLTGNL